MEQQDQMELDFEFIETPLPEGGKLLRMERHSHLENGSVRDNWFAVEKFVVNGWKFITADNQYYYLEKVY